jgi:gluconokinase
MPAALVESQFATLEPLQADEHGSLLNVEQPVDDVVRQSLMQLTAEPSNLYPTAPTHLEETAP